MGRSYEWVPFNMQSVWSAWFSVLCLMWSIIPLSDWSVELRISAKYEKSTKLNFTSLETVEPTADVTARKVTINPVSGFGFVKSQSSWRHANRNFLTHFNSIIFKIRIDRALTLTFLFVSDVLHFIVIGWLGLARRGGGYAVHLISAFRENLVGLPRCGSATNCDA